MRQERRDCRVLDHPPVGLPRNIIDVVAHDPVSEKLPRSAPIADEALIEAFGRYEALTITELHDAFARATERFKAWVEDPTNAGRPLSDAPDYVDRIAIDSLIERRTWQE
jgi:hypothetical protein